MMRTCMIIAVLMGATSVRGQDDATRAEVLLTKGLYNDARVMWERVMNAEGRTPRALIGVGKSLFYLQENGRSDSLFAEAWKLDQTMSEPLVFRGLIAERRSQVELARQRPNWRRMLQDAVRFYQAASVVGDDSFRCHYWASEALLALGLLEDAVIEIGKARGIRPKDRAARLFQLRLSLKAGQLQRIAPLIEAIKEPSPEECLVGLSAHARLKNFDAARSLFVRLLQPDSLGDDPRVWMAVFSPWSGPEDRGQLESLLANEEVMQSGGSLVDYFTGELASQAGDHGAAARAFARYVKRVPDDGAGWTRLISSHLVPKKWDAATQVVMNALPVLGGAAELVRLGQLVVAGWVGERDFDRALTLQGALLKQSPTDLRLLQGQAALLKETGRLIACESLLRRVLQRDDLDAMERANFLNDMALCIKGAGRDDEAMSVFQASADQTAFSLDARENLAALLMERRKFKAASALIAEVLLMDPDRARARYYNRALSDQMR